eukprot:gene2033-1223_t
MGISEILSVKQQSSLQRRSCLTSQRHPDNESCSGHLFAFFLDSFHFLLHYPYHWQSIAHSTQRDWDTVWAMFTADTGSVEVSSFKQRVAELILQGAARHDGRAMRTDIRTPSIVYEQQPAHRPGNSSGPLASLMYSDDRGTCLTCEVRGVFGPPPLHSLQEGRLTVHAAAPLQRRHGADGSSGGMEMLRAVDTVATGQEELPLRQVEGFVSRVLRRCVDLRQLCIIEGEACWVLSLHIMLLNVDGGVFGGVLAAAVAALRALPLPRSVLPNGDIVEPRTLRLSAAPVAMSYAILAHPTERAVWLADPCAGEEIVADSHLTLTLDEDGNLIDLRQLGPVMGLENAILKHGEESHLLIRKALGWQMLRPASTCCQSVDLSRVITLVFLFLFVCLFVFNAGKPQLAAL